MKATTAIKLRIGRKKRQHRQKASKRRQLRDMRELEQRSAAAEAQRC